MIHTLREGIFNNLLTKHPVIEIAFASSLADWVCASPVLRPRLDVKTRVATNFIKRLFMLFSP
jgi:hypothetical protein